MNCTEARDALLTADLGELKGRSASPLTAHIAGCATCTRTAAVIAQSTARLRRRRAMIARRNALLAIASAAAVVVLAARETRRAPRDLPRRVTLQPLPVVRHVSLEVGRGQQATVLKTNNPK